MSDRPKIILTMIVKNEAAVLPRLFASIDKRLYDAVVVLDTGSTDGTKRVIRECSQRPVRISQWQFDPFHFGDARSFALTKARQYADCSERAYALMVDADEQFDVTPGFNWPEDMTDPTYLLRHRDGDFGFAMMNLFRLDLPWRYEGVLHEYPVLDGFDTRTARLAGIAGLDIVAGHDGARSAGISPTEKYLRDADVLMDEISPRTVYYLAQSLKGAERFGEARVWYQAYLTMPDDDPEQYFLAELNIAVLAEALGENPARQYHNLIADYPQRAEPLRYLAAWLRKTGGPLGKQAADDYDHVADTLPVPSATNLLDLSAYGKL